MEDLHRYCSNRKTGSTEFWEPAGTVRAVPDEGQRLGLEFGDDRRFRLNDWSFGQLCRMSGVPKDTVNRLSPETAVRVIDETFPYGGRKPLQLYAIDDRAISLHGTSYTRLYDVELLDVVRESAGDFEPPPVGFNGGTGLYAGEQDVFCFLIDPTGDVEIGDERFFPGLFAWNSEVGRRTVGVSTFWYQMVCGNHIVWDVTDVTVFTRKHTSNVRDALSKIQQIIDSLVQTRNERRDGFSKVIESAMRIPIGETADEVKTMLGKSGISRPLASEATEMATKRGDFSVFGLVDALTRISGRIPNAGERTETDRKVAGLLSLAA